MGPMVVLLPGLLAGDDGGCAGALIVRTRGDGVGGSDVGVCCTGQPSTGEPVSCRADTPGVQQQ